MGKKSEGLPVKSDHRYYDAYMELGDYALASTQCGVKVETIRRSVRKVKSVMNETEDTPDAMLLELKNVFTPAEIRAMIKGKKGAMDNHTAIHNFSGETIRIGVMTDTHIGSKYTNNEYIYEAFRVFERENVDMMVHAGDVCEGMSNRAGHVLECTEIGYQRQRDKAVEIFSQYGHSEQYFISGNHDDWFKMSNGACIVQDICANVDGAKFLGHSEGNIQIGATQVRLWHGLDGSSYAHSYRMQKIIESLTGGDKPSVLIAGHTHKAFYVYDRHVHCISAGCIQKQSSWMRGKRLPAHTGFWVIEMVLNDLGVARFKSEFFPFYM